jgi:hypothetical protein
LTTRQGIAPHRLNTSIAWLFMVGSACFALGAVPWYASFVGATADALTFFLGSIFFTTASYRQLLQAQSPAMAADAAEPDDQRAQRLVRFAWLPRDRGWLSAATQFPGTLAFNVSTLFAVSASLTAAQGYRLVWRPDFVGSVLFLASSTFGILALARTAPPTRSRRLFGRIAWTNMAGSVFFMASAIGSLVVPATGSVLDERWMNLGTFLGAVCFFVAAGLLLPAWTAARAEVRTDPA